MDTEEREDIKFTKTQRFNHKLYCPIEIYVALGSTFDIFPDIGVIAGYFSIDWPWFHLQIKFR